MNYSSERRLRRLKELAVSADIIEDRIQELLKVVGRRAEGWREANAEMKLLQHKIFSHYRVEVRKLSLYGYNEKIRGKENCVSSLSTPVYNKNNRKCEEEEEDDDDEIKIIISDRSNNINSDEKGIERHHLLTSSLSPYFAQPLVIDRSSQTDNVNNISRNSTIRRITPLGQVNSIKTETK